MNYTLTEHAHVRMAARKIASAWVEQALENPVLTEQDEVDPALEHRLAVIAEAGNRVLRVVCDPKLLPVRVITLHFDRSMKGKL